MVPRFCRCVLSVCLFIYQLAYDVRSLIRSRVRDSSCFLGNSPTHWAVVMQLTIQANLCSVTVAVMEPRFCLSSTPVRAKECLWVPASDWGAPVDLFHALSVGQQEGQKHRQCFLSLFSTSTWLKNCTPHFLKHRGEDRWVALRDSHPKLVCGGDEASASFQVPTLKCHLRPLIHHDSSPMTPLPLFCKLKTLCTLLTTHSVTSWLAGRLAAVNWLVLDCVQPHGSCCDLKAYLH